MNVSVQREPLLKALTRVQSVVDKRHSMAVLTNVLMETQDKALALVATDLEVSLSQQIDAKISTSGRCAVSARTLFEIVRESNVDEIHLELADNHGLAVSYGSSRFRLMGIQPDEHPGMPGAGNGGAQAAGIVVEVEDLADMIRKTLFAVSSDDTRSNLAGVYLDRGSEAGTVRFVATDGHRLAVVDRKADGQLPEEGVILPRKGLNEVGKLLGEQSGQVTLKVVGNEAVVELTDAVLSMRQVEGSFPDYEKVVPENTTKNVRAGRDALLQTVRRVSILSSERARGVRFRLQSGSLEISANNPDLGEAREDLEVEYEGDALDVGFNARYLLDVLGVLPEGSTVTIGLGDELSPGVLQGDDKGYQYVVMPMRI